MARTEKKTIRGYIPAGMKAADIFRFRKIPAYETRLLHARKMVTSKRLIGDESEVRITVEVLTK